jgi:hypothetical protein
VRSQQFERPKNPGSNLGRGKRACASSAQQVKMKVPPGRACTSTEGMWNCSWNEVATLLLEGGSAPRSGRFNSEKYPVPIVQEAGL